MWFNCGWLVGRSGYIGMQGLLFVWERSGSGRECHWWLQRRRMNLQEVFSLSLSRLPRSHSLCLSFPIFFFLCVRTFTVPSLSLLRPQSPGTTTALSCPVNTHTPLLYWVPTFARARETQGHCSYSYPHHCSCLDGVFVWASVLEWWIVFCMCHTSD